MKITKIILAAALVAASVDFAEAAPVAEAAAGTATLVQLPPPPPAPPLPRVRIGGGSRRYTRHRRYVRRSSGDGIHLPPPPPAPPRPPLP